MTDFNTVEPQKTEFPLIPDGSIVKVRMGIVYGGYGEDNALTHNEATGSVGLKATFVVVDGEYKDRNIIQLIGFKGAKVNEEGKDIWGNSGKSLLRGLIESAKGISSKDTSVLGTTARKVSLKELDDMVCLVKVGVEKDKSGKYSDKNKIKYALTADHKEYANYMTIPEKKQASTNTLPDDEIPF